jgi:hypothetical protein
MAFESGKTKNRRKGGGINANGAGMRPAQAAPQISAYDQAYDELYNAQAEALNAAYLAQLRRYEAQLPKIGRQYDALSALRGAAGQSKLAARQDADKFNATLLNQAAEREAQMRQSGAQRLQKEKQDALAEAYKQLEVFGRIMTQRAADALGVNRGDTLYDLRNRRML